MKKPMKKALNCVVDDATYGKVSAIAKASQISKGDVIRKAVKFYLTKVNKVKQVII